MKHVAWVVLVVLLVAAPAYAGDLDGLMPDEYGLGTFLFPAVADTDRVQNTLSWELFPVRGYGIYLTVLRMHIRPGGGLDFGELTGPLRFGYGYLDGQTHGFYVRSAF